VAQQAVQLQASQLGAIGGNFQAAQLLLTATRTHMQQKGNGALI
jgi:hypothetical protein